MSIISQFAKRLQSGAKYLESPSLVSLRQKGGNPSSYVELNQTWFHTLNIATVLDIGANSGQFAITINMLLPKAYIYSFEPLPDCFNKLQKRMIGVSNFSGFNIGLGDQQGEIGFEQNDFLASSSFLQMTEAHKIAFPYTRKSKKVLVKIDSLDRIADAINLIDPLLIKVDVQGYEDRVLRGGEKTIKRSKMVIIETSFEKLYEGQPHFDDIYRLLTGWGFKYAGSLDQLYSPQDGRVLQQDSVFVR